MNKHNKETNLMKKIVCEACPTAFYAVLNAAKAKTIEDLLETIPFYCTLKCICRFLKFIHSLNAEPCRSRAEICYKAILDVVKEKTAESIEEIILEILAAHGLNLKPFWYLIKPAICAFIKSIRKDTR
ncbi:MAG: hypothetical protein ACR2P4_09145 [Gammaproteobacteria bacterium]